MCARDSKDSKVTAFGLTKKSDANQGYGVAQCNIGSSLTPKVIDRYFKNVEASETYPPCDIVFVYKLHGHFIN